VDGVGTSAVPDGSDGESECVRSGRRAKRSRGEEGGGGASVPAIAGDGGELVSDGDLVSGDLSEEGEEEERVVYSAEGYCAGYLCRQRVYVVKEIRFQRREDVEFVEGILESRCEARAVKRRMKRRVGRMSALARRCR
jgi:hypothetical protein